MSEMSTTQKIALTIGTELLVHTGPSLARIQPLRRAITHKVEEKMINRLHQVRVTSQFPPGIDEDRTLIGLSVLHAAERAMKDNRLSPATRRGLFKILIQKLMLEGTDPTTIGKFEADHGAKPPMFLLISPSKACNLRCIGCYADSDGKEKKINWETFDRLITEAKTLWGSHFFAISGGEPLAYRSEGKGILDIAKKHPDCFFIMYTNGTLIDDQVANRMAQLGNLTPAVSLEGWREKTDARRGIGVFDKAVAAMGRLRKAGVLFGVSITPTRQNAEEILSDSFIDFCFQEQGALYGFMFQYMPIGRSITLDLMPTPEQRLWMWRRSWELIRERQIFLADFWNHGTLSQGCLSAGGFSGWGYLYVDWNGNVSPCVFMPYSPVNLHEIYAHGKNLNDLWEEPFFGGLRNWQKAYRQKQGNWLQPCPIRDHHAEFRRLIAQYEPEPIDENARAALLDPEYARGLEEYDAAYQKMSDPIWTSHYLQPSGSTKDPFRALPKIDPAKD
jgi:MoaA/NifB/PqqE/SkfB family radical SAM enzyme